VLRLSSPEKLEAPLAVESVLCIVLFTPTRISYSIDRKQRRRQQNHGQARANDQQNFPHRGPGPNIKQSISASQGVAITHEVLSRTLASKMSDSPVRERETSRHRDNA
jgi:hypothetical protein